MSKYYKLKVEKVVKETADTISIHFQQPQGARLSYKPGQYLTLLVNVNGKSLRRSYSMSSCPHTDDIMVVTVKRVADGQVSNYLNDKLKPGDEVEVMEPMGNFFIDAHPARQRHVVLIGAGSGITPLMSIAKTVLFAEKNSQVSLLYGNRNEESIIFRKELEQMETQYAGRLKVIHILSQPSTPGQGVSSKLKQLFKFGSNNNHTQTTWQGLTGRLNQSVALKIFETLPKWEADRTEYFLCGPEGMMDEMKKALNILHVPSNRIHWEKFVTAQTPETHGDVELGGNSKPEAKALEVTIIYEGSEYKVNVPSDKTILEAALEQDIDLPYSCQSGSCTACRGKCLSGKVKLDEEDGLSDYELREGYVLTCVGHPLTPDVTIEIG